MWMGVITGEEQKTKLTWVSAIVFLRRKKNPNHDELLAIEITREVFRFNMEAAAERSQGTTPTAVPIHLWGLVYPFPLFSPDLSEAKNKHILLPVVCKLSPDSSTSSSSRSNTAKAEGEKKGPSWKTYLGKREGGKEGGSARCPPKAVPHSCSIHKYFTDPNSACQIWTTALMKNIKRLFH